MPLKVHATHILQWLSAAAITFLAVPVSMGNVVALTLLLLSGAFCVVGLLAVEAMPNMTPPRAQLQRLQKFLIGAVTSAFLGNTAALLTPSNSNGGFVMAFLCSIAMAVILVVNCLKVEKWISQP